MPSRTNEDLLIEELTRFVDGAEARYCPLDSVKPMIRDLQQLLMKHLPGEGAVDEAV